MCNMKEVPVALIMMVAMVAGFAAAEGETGMESLPAEVAAQTEFIAGRYGQAIRLKDSKGLRYLCDRKTFPVEEGTFSCWIRAPRGVCRKLFTTESTNVLLRIWPHSKDDKDAWQSVVPYGGVQKRNGFCESPMLIDTWYQLTMTWILNKDNPNGKGRMHLYVNGQGGQSRYQHKWMAPFNYDLNPGAYFELGLLPCELDDVVILDKFLSPEEVRKLYFSAPHQPGEHTRFYLSFDGNTPDGLVRSQENK